MFQLKEYIHLSTTHLFEVTIYHGKLLLHFAFTARVLHISYYFHLILL
jgi:hypothetical protein